jgi:benzylsuccinate CoA-transferase BbsF subunit
VFPCAGDDHWIAIACHTDDQRSALADLVGGIDDASICGWTTTRTAHDATTALQAVGVPSHPAQRSADMLDDPQLIHLEHFRRFPHPALGEVVVEGPRVRYSRTPATTDAPGPTLGQHSEHVVKELLGYDDERFIDLVVAGVIS